MPILEWIPHPLEFASTHGIGGGALYAVYAEAYTLLKLCMLDMPLAYTEIHKVRASRSPNLAQILCKSIWRLGLRPRPCHIGTSNHLPDTVLYNSCAPFRGRVGRKVASTLGRGCYKLILGQNFKQQDGKLKTHGRLPTVHIKEMVSSPAVDEIGVNISNICCLVFILVSFLIDRFAYK